MASFLRAFGCVLILTAIALGVSSANANGPGGPGGAVVGDCWWQCATFDSMSHRCINASSCTSGKECVVTAAVKKK